MKDTSQKLFDTQLCSNDFCQTHVYNGVKAKAVLPWCIKGLQIIRLANAGQAWNFEASDDSSRCL